ncbi:BLUF domain-containing protein [Sphingomonas aerophila]|uniref:BLUF domain-containing protein n=1 Tax=Sphingomonas aerophila TaxID=1344948 RepID=UPI003CCE3277
MRMGRSCTPSRSPRRSRSFRMTTTAAPWPPFGASSPVARSGPAAGILTSRRICFSRQCRLVFRPYFNACSDRGTTTRHVHRSVAMHRLIFISRSLVGTDPGALDAIVDRSATLNQRQGITGMLWSDGSSFAQVLEGESQAVAETMNRIRVDRRHTEIEVVLDRPVVQRMFE